MSHTITVYPLTKNFHVPASCGSITIVTYLGYGYVTSTNFRNQTTTEVTTTSQNGLRAYGTIMGPGNEYSSSLDSACYPSHFLEVDHKWGIGDPLIATYFSPGICPGAWVTQGTSLIDATWDGTSSIGSTWEASCCPSGFTMEAGPKGVPCVSSITTRTVAYDARYSLVPISDGLVAARPIRIRQGPSSQDTLSSGAQAGIGFGAALAALLLITAFICVYRRKKLRKSAIVEGPPHDSALTLVEIPKATQVSHGRMLAQTAREERV